MYFIMISRALCSISIIFIYVSSVNGDLPSETGPVVQEPFPKEKCESLLVNCSCFDYEVVYGMVCDGMNDFPNFTNLLATGMIFEINATYEISLTGVSYLPAKSLDGLIVFRLTVDDPDLSEIDKDIFEGVIRLRRFHIRQSKLKQIPDFRVIRHSIRNINIDSSELTSLDGPGLQNLSLLETISFVNNSIRYVDADTFKGTEKLIILDLSHNLLTYLPPHLIDPFTQLRKLCLSYNQLLHVDQLFAVTHPRFIYLDFNNLTDVDSILYPGMTNVETVIFASNPITNISQKSFIGKVPKVRFLYLDHCLLRDFDVQHFQNLSSLAILDMSNNLIEEIKKQSINFGKSLEIDLSGNQIRRFDGEITFTIKRIYLDENKLQSLGRTLQYSQMTEVSVARNLLQCLAVEDFKGVHGTTNLELQGNRIQWIDRDTFREIQNDLHYLDLSSNLIPALNGSIRFLSQLKSLNMSDNLLETFERGDFTGLNELSELYLQHNRIKDLSGQLQLLPQLQYIVITHNNVDVLRPEQIPKSLKYIYLADNPLKCDCRLLPFMLWLNTSSSPETDIQLCPPSTSDENRTTLSARCPDMCSCSCAEEGVNYFMSVNCSSRNLTDVPPFLTADFLQIQDTSPITFDFRRSLTFDQNTNPYFHLRDRVLGIDLQNNSIESFDSAQLPVELLHLYLSKNKLRTLPESMFYNLKHLKRVSLSGNPWNCDCQAIGFKQWIVSRMDIIQDVNTTRCGNSEHDSALVGKVISALTDLDLCPADVGLYVSLTFGILTFVLLGLATKMLYTKYKRTILAYLYRLGCTCVKERDLDPDKEYDAFISYSHRDYDFVTNEIISTLERKDPNIRLFYHDRHFVGGMYIPDNIVRAVQISKKTVLIMTRNFLESEWCRFEFMAAQSQEAKDKLSRIIVIKVGNLPDVIDPAIQAYLNSTTYIKWENDEHFWTRLWYSLPEPTLRTPRCAETHQNGKLKQMMMESFAVKT